MPVDDGEIFDLINTETLLREGEIDVDEAIHRICMVGLTNDQLEYIAECKRKGMTLKETEEGLDKLPGKIAGSKREFFKVMASLIRTILAKEKEYDREDEDECEDDIIESEHGDWGDRD